MARREWEQIGSEGPVMGAVDLNRVPTWVQNALTKMHRRDINVFRSAEDSRRPIRLKGKTYEYAVHCSGHGGQYRDFYRRKRRRQLEGTNNKRSRATGLVARDGRVLLVRDRSRRRFSLPGGKIEGPESGTAAAVREIEEETGLEVVSATLLFQHEGKVNRHQVVGIEAKGRVKLQRRELDGHRWWDGQSDLPVDDHVRQIVSKARLFETS